MKAITFLSIGAILLMSCNPCQKLARKCPPVIRDSISYIETIKFDTIKLVSPADTLFIRIPVEPDINDLIIDVQDKPGPSIKIKIKDGILEAEVICPEDSLKAIIAKLETELNNQTTITVEKVVEVYKLSKLGWIAIIFSVSCIILFVVWLYLKFKTTALNRLKMLTGKLNL